MDIIFGASGFIGSNLFNYIKSRHPKSEVIGISRRSQNKKNLISLDLKYNKKLLSLNFNNIDKVFICAGDARIIFNNKIEEKIQIENNTLIIKNIIKFCVAKQVKKIIFISSSAVYGKFNKYPLSENQILKPASAMGKIKKNNEIQLKKIAQKFKIKILILRLFTSYGNLMRKDQFIYEAIKKLKSKSKKIIFWNPNTYRNLIFIDDLVKIIYILSNKNKKSYEILNVASKQSLTIEKIIQIILNTLKLKKVIIFKHNLNNFSHFVDTSRQDGIIRAFKFTKLYNGLKKML